MSDQGKRPDANNAAQMQVSDQIDHILSDTNIPKIYFNSFVNFGASADLAIILQNGNVANAVIQCSLSTAKSLVVQLADLINLVEDQVGTQFLSTEEIGARLQQSVDSE